MSIFESILWPPTKPSSPSSVPTNAFRRSFPPITSATLVCGSRLIARSPRSARQSSSSASRGSFGANEKNYIMRQILTVLIAACLLNFSPICRAAYAAAEPEVVDGVAAVVNGDVVTYSQVRGLVAPREKLLRAQFNGDE